MAYQTGSFTSNFNLAFIVVGCNTNTFWFPGGEATRDAITNAYFSILGRYGESGGIEYHYNLWAGGVGPSLYPSIYAMVYQSAVNSGELGAVNAYGRHTNMATGACPTAPQLSFVIYKQDGSNAGIGNVTFGQYVTLSWNVVGVVTSVSINNGIGAVAASGSRIYYPTAAGTYFFTLTAIGPGGTRNATFGFTVSNPPPPPPSSSLTVSPASIIRGQSATLSWSSTNANNATITNVGAVPTNGSTTVSPSSTTSYTLTVTGSGGASSSSTTLTVYIPPITNITADNTTLIRGQSTILRWNTTGDANTANVTPGIGPSNLSSFVSISPTVTTTYTIYVSGPGGSATSSVTVTVLNPPSVTLSGPLSVDYEEPVQLQYSVVNAGTLQLIVSSIFTNGSTTVETINLSPADTSTGRFTHNVPYNNFGPTQISYTLSAAGAGAASVLTDSESIVVPINIDFTPDLIQIPDSDGLVKDQTPVISPEEETSITLQVQDIDIPVEVKADKPVQVQFVNNGNWLDIRQI